MRSVAVRSFVVLAVTARVSVLAVTVTVVLARVSVLATTVMIPEVVAAEPAEVTAEASEMMVVMADVTALGQTEPVVVQTVPFVAAVVAVTVATTVRGICQRGVEAGQRHGGGGGRGVSYGSVHPTEYTGGADAGEGQREASNGAVAGLAKAMVRHGAISCDRGQVHER